MVILQNSVLLQALLSLAEMCLRLDFQFVSSIFHFFQGSTIFERRGSCLFFCLDRHPRTDFLGRIRGEEKDGKIENIGFISIFALELAFLDRKMKVA